MDMYEELSAYEAQGKQIKVGVVGAGQMGEGLVCQMALMRGMRGRAVADVLPGRASEALESSGVPTEDIVQTEDPGTAAQAIADGKYVATVDSAMLPEIPDLDILVEATGVPEIGALVAWQAILARKHVMQMNVETDATVGYVLRKLARSAGVVYTLTGGDEPGSTMELMDFARTLGFNVVCAGKGKNNTLDRTATPDSVSDTAKKQRMNPKMLASFVDGTKTMVEMTSLGNAIGFAPDVRGMHGPNVTPKTIAEVFIPKSDGGVLDNANAVEFGIGIAPGVFVVFTTDHPKIVRDLRYMNLGPGPYWALYRPYHLANIETPISIAHAVLRGETTLATDIPPACETIAIAKRDLKAGEKVDSLGGFTVFGMIERADVAKKEAFLPLGVAPGSLITRDVRKGEPLTFRDVELNEQSTILQLRRLQQKMLN